MNNDDIKKIVSETISNPDILDFIAKQIQDQIEKEQSKIKQDKIPETKIDNHTKDKINDIKSKANNYNTNNGRVNKYISEREKYADIFKKVADKINKKDNDEEITQEPSKKTWTQNISQVSMMHNFSDGWYKWHQETTDGKIWGNIFFDLVRGNNNNFDTFLNIYSILTLYADQWENWEIDHYDNTLYNLPISKLVDTYTYNFTADESKKIDNNEDMVYSYTHVEIDNELPMVSIYIMDYSKKTNKVYDFNRIIFTPSDNASENDRQLFYFDLYKYLNNPLTIETVLEDFCYTFINKYIIHGVSDFPTTDKEYYNLMHSLINSLLEEKKKDGIKLTIKKEDTPDKTNSILDKLGIPHDNGVVNIPISDDKFISNRMDSMNKASEFLKSWFDLDEEEDIAVDPNNQDLKQFFMNVINDGFIKVEVFSPEHIHLNINGTLVFLKNPYASMNDRDTFGNKR